jgi:nucleotide-binding universal stress UspA family protein
MTWTRILAPVIGSELDDSALGMAAAMAGPFEAHLTAVYAAAHSASMFPWNGDGTAAGLEMAVGALQLAVSTGEADARARLSAHHYAHKEFGVSCADNLAALRISARLADVVVFNRRLIRDGSLLAGAFQQILMDERRPVLIGDKAPNLSDTVAVAWDGGREASRAARRAVPWLRKARDVFILAAPGATPREFDPGRLIAYLADQGVQARPLILSPRGEAGPLLLDAAHRLGVKMLVAGAFGHPRFQRFIFGGTTQTLLDDQAGPALFLSH